MFPIDLVYSGQPLLQMRSLNHSCIVIDACIFYKMTFIQEVASPEVSKRASEEEDRTSAGQKQELKSKSGRKTTSHKKV